MLRNTEESTFQIFCFLKTRVSGARADSIIAKLGFRNLFRVNGFARGIWLCWNDDIRVEILKSHPQVVHIRLGDLRNSKHFLCSIVYASPHATTKRELWPFLSSLAATIMEPWILARDFNCILDSTERLGGAPISQA